MKLIISGVTELGGADEVALVLTILVVDDYHHAYRRFRSSIICLDRC